MDTFRAGAMISFGWETFKKRPWFLIGAVVVASLGYGIVSGVVDGILVALIGKAGGAAVLEELVRFVFQVFLGMGMISFFLKVHDDVHSAALPDLWHPQPFWHYAGATVLLILIIVIGFILLIVPGIIAMVTLMFTTYLVVDRSLGPIEALKESARITKGHRLDLFVLVLAIIGITLLGLVCLFVGIFVAAPVAALATAHAYRTLEHAAGEVAPVSA